MALVVYWYDFICFAVVVGAFIGSLWVLWRKEADSRCEDNTRYESLLLLARPDSDGLVRATGMAHVGSSQLWTSCWKGMHPGWLLVTRFVSFVVMSGFLTWDIVDWDATIFVYYTEWTFTLVVIYFALGTIVSAYGCWVCATRPPDQNGARDEVFKKDVEEGKSTSTYYRENELRGNIKLQSYYTEEEFSQRAGFWGYVMQAMYQTCGGAVIMTDIVFWCVIVPFLSNSHLGLNTLMGCMHTVNAIFLLLDTAINSLPFPWFRLAYFVQWSCLYVVFQWVIHACGFTWWPYPFLELDTTWAPLWYLCLAILHIPCYGIYALIIKAKNSIFPRFFRRAFVGSY
ncbi:hypothetical protein CFOL_v3_20555 [Cephalotus follicularis]|uniref:Uncharacterized protein n=1 Tax=Cephalotus follicularis TaxID=3775 RepID=A0A1Q3CAH1_CEPFO|nr:hypothetical protein CFOL_v3_20555 [Cephalotus follicularis]